jgi:hypothetical protein
LTPCSLSRLARRWRPSWGSSSTTATRKASHGGRRGPAFADAAGVVDPWKMLAGNLEERP